jgi:hypothetical protein
MPPSTQRGSTFSEGGSDLRAIPARGQHGQQTLYLEE